MTEDARYIRVRPFLYFETAKTPSHGVIVETPKEHLLLRREPDNNVDGLAHAIIGAAIEVHRALGPGFLESVYEEALCVEMGLRGIPFERKVKIAVTYKEHSVGERRLD